MLILLSIKKKIIYTFESTRRQTNVASHVLAWTITVQASLPIYHDVPFCIALSILNEMIQVDFRPKNNYIHFLFLHLSKSNVILVFN